MLVKTYLTSYPELINEQNIKNTDMLSWMSFIHPYDSLPELKNKNPQKYEDVNKKFYTFVDIENRFLDYKPFILSQGLDLKYATIRIPKVFYCNKNVQHFNNTLDAFGPGLRNYFNLEPATMGNASPAVIVVKSLINGNLYFTPEELQRRIIHCNYVIKKRLELITQKYS